MKSYFSLLLAFLIFGFTTASAIDAPALMPLTIVGGSGGVGGDWYDDWGRYTVLSIDQVGANLTLFPVLLTQDSFDSEMFDTDDGDYAANKAQDDCGDLRFYSGDYSVSRPVTENTDRLPIEIVNCAHGSNPIIEIYLGTNLSDASATTVTVYYNATGKISAAEGSGYGKHNVWDTSFELVQHLNEDPSIGLATDSTSNSNDGTIYNMDSVDLITGAYASGTQGKGYSFSGTSEYIDFGSSSTMEFATTSFTLHAWGQFASGHSTPGNLLFYGDTADEWYSLSVSSTATIAMIIDDDAVKSETNATDTFADDTWHYFVGMRDVAADYLRIYFDGSEDDESPDSDNSADISNPAYKNVFAASKLSSGVTGDILIGMLDELRISSMRRLDAWIAAEYSNMSNPGGFVTEGSPGDI